MSKKYRKFDRDFKIKVLRELERGRSAAEVSREYELHASQVSKWKQEYLEDPKSAFRGRGRRRQGSQETRIKELESLVGKLYAENEFLKKVLTNLETKLVDEKEGR